MCDDISDFLINNIIQIKQLKFVDLKNCCINLEIIFSYYLFFQHNEEKNILNIIFIFS